MSTSNEWLEDMYIMFCRFLGVNYAKKYIPIVGSYWHKTKLIDKNSISDMESIIDLGHVTNISIISWLLLHETTPIINYVTSKIMGDPTEISLYPLCITGGLFFGYMLMVNNYNGIMARRRMNQLKSQNGIKLVQLIAADVPLIPTVLQQVYHSNDEPVLYSNGDLVLLEQTVVNESALIVSVKNGEHFSPIPNLPVLKDANVAKQFIDHLVQLMNSNSMNSNMLAIYNDYMMSLEQEDVNDVTEITTTVVEPEDLAIEI